MQKNDENKENDNSVKKSNYLPLIALLIAIIILVILIIIAIPIVTKESDKSKDNEVEDKTEKKTLYKVIQASAKGGTYAKEYTGPHQDSMDGSGKEKIYYWYAKYDSTIDTVLNKNNIIFAGFCWQMMRTTDTGGIKMIYNGVPSSDGKCNNIEVSTQIGRSEFNSINISPAYVGYMYNPTSASNYSSKSKNLWDSKSNIKYGKSFTYEDGKYKLKDVIQFSDWGKDYNKLDNNHYTCFNETGECKTLSYIYHINDYEVYYINLKDGKSIEDALNEMLWNDDVNVKDSTIKEKIDAWYKENMTDYSDYLEDTIFCNNRSIEDLGTWNPNEKVTGNYLYFKNNKETSDLSCPKETDRFSISNPKAKLKYKVGLMTDQEMNLLSHNALRKAKENYWISSPHGFFGGYALGKNVNSDGASDGYAGIASEMGIRPVVSLKKGTTYSSGNGSKDKPYIVE